MLKWLTNNGNAVDAPVLDLDRVAEQDVAVVFKHSTSCPISFMADREMSAFQKAHPQVPFYKVLVREQRDLSRQIAERTGVRHESPQVIVLKRGMVAWSGSHSDVNENLVDDALSASA